MNKIYYFNKLKVGDKGSSVARTITETDIVNFSGISGDYNLIHTDIEYAKKGYFGERIAHGLLVMSIASGLFTRTEFNARLSPALIAFGKIKEWKFIKPVKIGDTVHVEVEVIEKKDSNKNRGRITLRRNVINQNNEIVHSGDTEMIIKKES